MTFSRLPRSIISHAASDPLFVEACDPSDGTIVRRVLGGDVEAFGLLVVRHRPVLLRFARRMLGDQADAEDAVQEAFVRGYGSLDQCEDPDRVAAWLYAIVVNRCRTRSVQRHRRKQRFVQDDVAMQQAQAGGPSVADGVAQRDALETALASLDADSRAIFLMKYVDGVSYEAMARTMGMGISALKMRVSRTRDRLREILKA